LRSPLAARLSPRVLGGLRRKETLVATTTSRVKTWEVFPPFSGRPEQVNPKVDRMPGNLEKLEEVVEGLAARVLPPKRPMLKLIDDRDA
jgi:hypothetical protein